MKVCVNKLTCSLLEEKNHKIHYVKGTCRSVDFSAIQFSSKLNMRPIDIMGDYGMVAQFSFL